MNRINAKMLSQMLVVGAKNLESKKEWINDLNVFPVPDGDTGTNMTMTIMAAVSEVAKLDNPTMDELAKTMSSGSLRGARGNSGVILSQLIRGFAKVIKEHEYINISICAQALEKGAETAYKAVMKPKEGTILTVAKAASVKARELADNGCVDMAEFFEKIILRADEVLEQTPDMLPVLKQAGVVDSGGQGLMQILKGAVDAYMGRDTDYSLPEYTKANIYHSESKEITSDDIKFGYCTEFIINLNKTFNIKNEIDFKDYLESIGDSIVLVSDDEVVKIHVHTNDPGLAIQRALKYGSLSNLKIDNMRIEHNEILVSKKDYSSKVEDKTPLKEVGFVVVAAGEGIGDIFKGLGADVVIEGGQTMNPSSEDIVEGVKAVRAKMVFVLPNNKNIILAADQARYLIDDTKIVVIPSKTIPQGISSMIAYAEGESIEANIENMTDELENVSTGQITYAVRDTQIDDKSIKQGDYMGIGDNGLLEVGQDIEEVVIGTVDKMVKEEHEIISIYYGSDVSETEANNLSKKLKDLYQDYDMEIQYGGQPVYYYIISAE